MARACPVCDLPGPRHIGLLHVVHQERNAAVRCGCDPDLHDQTGPCFRAAGHTGICVGPALNLCPACRDPWAGHHQGAPDLTAPGAGRDPNPPWPWVCAVPGCECGAWTPYDQPLSVPAGELMLFGCRDDDSAPHPLAAALKETPMPLVPIPSDQPERVR